MCTRASDDDGRNESKKFAKNTKNIFFSQENFNEIFFTHVNIKTYYVTFSVDAFKPLLCKITTNAMNKSKKLFFCKKKIPWMKSARIISRYMRICEKAEIKLKLSRHRFYQIWWIIACPRIFLPSISYCLPCSYLLFVLCEGQGEVM